MLSKVYLVNLLFSKEVGYVLADITGVKLSCLATYP